MCVCGAESPDQASVCDITAHKDQPKWAGMRGRRDIHDCVGKRSLREKSERHLEGKTSTELGNFLDLGFYGFLHGEKSSNLGTRENWGVWVRVPK